MAKKAAHPLILGIDFGTTKIAAVVAGFNNERLEILGASRAPFDGYFTETSHVRGLAEAASLTRKTVKEACRAAGCQTESAIIGISGFVNSCNSAGVIGIEGQVSQADIQRAKSAAADFAVPGGLMMLKQVIGPFYINQNDEERIDNPLGMSAERLEVMSHNIFVRKTVCKEIEAVSRLAGLEIMSVASSELAAAEILLTREDRQKGVCLLDIGGEYASLVIYHAGMLKYSASVPWGGNHLNNRIRFLIGENATRAEQAKLAYSQRASTDGTDEQNGAIRTLIDEELPVLCSHLDTELCKSGMKNDVKGGIVLTGGTAILPGLRDAVAGALQIPVRMARFPEEARLEGVSLEYAGAVGLVFK